jgi:hypothetical protein
MSAYSSDTGPSLKIVDLINSLLTDYQNSITTNLGKIDNNGIVTYITIFIICLFFAKLVRINLSFIFFCLLSVLLCFLVYKKREIEHITYDKQLEIKNKLITPRPQRIDKYPDFINFLYSIKEFYYVNPNDFYDVVINIDNFVQLYDQIMNNKMIYCTQNLEVALQFIRNAQNHLHTIIYNLDTDKNITKKYHESLRDFHLIAQQYMSRLIQKCNSTFDTKNINTTSKYYNEYGPKPVNYFSTGIESRFEFF